MSKDDWRKVLAKLLLSSALVFSGFIPLETKASAAPVKCVKAVRSLNLYFGETVPIYSSRQILESLRFCRINDWNRQVALRVSKSRTWDDYNYFAISATALRGTNLADLRKWMCSTILERRKKDNSFDQEVFNVLPGCGEKLGANTRRYVTTTTSTTSTTTTTTLPINLPRVFIKATNRTGFSNLTVWGKVDQQGNGKPEEWCLLLNGSRDWNKEASSLEIYTDKKSGELCESTGGRGSLTEFTALRGLGSNANKSLGCTPKGLSGVTVCMTATLILSFKFENGREVQSDPFTIYLRNVNNKFSTSTEFYWLPCNDFLDGGNYYCP